MQILEHFKIKFSPNMKVVVCEKFSIVNLENMD